MPNTNDKIFNTRIRLKYDSFDNWTTHNPLLLEGEVAVAYLGKLEPEISTSANPKDTNVKHPVMFKVGPGNFNDLTWASGLAADVYAWAKQDKLSVSKNGTGNVVASISWDASANNGKGGIVYETAAVATAEGLGDLQDALTVLTNTVNAMYTNAQIDEAIAGAKQEASNNLAAANEANAAALKEVSDALDAHKQANEASFANVYTKEEADNKFIETAYNDEAVRGLIQDNADAIAALDLVLKGALDNSDETALNSIKELADWIVTHEADTTITSAITKNTEDIAANKKLIEDHIAEADAEYATKEELADEVEVLEGAINDAKSALIGTNESTSATDTIKGAKKYVDEAIEGVNTTLANKANISDLHAIAIGDNKGKLSTLESDDPTSNNWVVFYCGSATELV